MSSGMLVGGSKGFVVADSLILTSSGTILRLDYCRHLRLTGRPKRSIGNLHRQTGVLAYELGIEYDEFSTAFEIQGVHIRT